MATSEPRFRLGFIAPPAVGAEQALRINEEQLLPPDVVRITVGLGISDYTTAGVEEAIGRYWSLVDELAAKGANYIILAGVPISSQLGRERVLRLLEETKRRTGITADSTNEAMIAAMQHLRMDRMTVASRWADELNRRLTEYFGGAGIKVEAITSEGQWAKEAFAMSVEKGFVLAMRLGREAMRLVPDAPVLLMPGGTWRSLAAVPLLEEEFGVHVITNQTAETWRLIGAGAGPAVQGWGRLLANP
ncbi:MAG: hypothetical protein EXR51_04250 [Dehalococcoidia bacterium]|nr:hypothetical protein [Dehalococcoidia bacterium]